MKQSALGMLPADERLDPPGRAIQPDQRLIVEDQLIGFDRVAQLGHQHQLLPGTVVLRRQVGGVAAALTFCDVHRHVCALQQDGKPLPGVAQVAKQEGAHAARNILRSIRGEPLTPFRYRDYGSMATIGRGSAVADFGRIKASGFPAWLMWLFTHIFWLIGFRNRIVVFSEWAWAYLTMQRRVRLITGERLWPGSD